MRRSGPSLDAGMRDEFLAWQSGDYAYTWQGNGMLRSVTRPDGKTVTFKYDALGRRIEKVFDGRVYRYLWNGDVILHEWDYAEADRPNTIVTETGEVTLDRPEPVENPITWVYDSDSYVPTAKIVGDRHYSIVSDYIGRPVQAYDDNGNIVWQADYDIYGNVRNLHGSRQFIPFRQLGQYEDEETGLYYNRFRYYDPRIGNYISQDPIRLGGGMSLYAYVHDTNSWIDLLGLSGMPKGGWNYGNMPKLDGYQLHHVIPKSMAEHPAIKAAGFDVNKPSNLIYLPKEDGIHSTRSIHNGWNKAHANYNADIKQKLNDIVEFGKAKRWSRQQYLDAIESLRGDTRLGLRKGEIKCY